MTRRELAKRFQAANRRGWLIFGPWTVLFIGFLGYLERHEAGSTKPASLLWLVGFFGFLLLNVAAVFAYTLPTYASFRFGMPSLRQGVNFAWREGRAVQRHLRAM